jgi:xanthine/uracil/vitamin C permease (AzgA family)
VTAALVTGGDVTIVVAAGVLELRLQQSSVRCTLVQVIPRNFHHATTAW